MHFTYLITADTNKTGIKCSKKQDGKDCSLYKTVPCDAGRMKSEGVKSIAYG